MKIFINHLLALVFVFSVHNVFADNAISGFENIPFGAPLEVVQKEILKKGMTQTGLVKEEDGYHIVQASRGDKWNKSTLTFIIDKKSDQLGLVIEDFTELLSDKALIKQMTDQYGKPLGEKATETLFEKIKAGLPADVERITVWADKQDRFVRVLYFGSHVAVEYLDTNIL